MLNAIEELHFCGFIHRDIKPNNFIVESNKIKTGLIYLIDFDISSRFSDKDGVKILQRKAKRFSGTVMYCSKAQHKMVYYFKKSDISTI